MQYKISLVKCLAAIHLIDEIPMARYGATILQVKDKVTCYRLKISTEWASTMSMYLLLENKMIIQTYESKQWSKDSMTYMKRSTAY